MTASSLRLLAIQARDARIEAACALEWAAKEARLRARDLTDSAERHEHEAWRLREMVETEAELLEMEREAERDVLPMRRRRG